MNEKEKMEFFYQMLGPDLPRLGPGADDMTVQAVRRLQAAGMKGGAGEPIEVLDIGCGTGAQTIALARTLDAKIVAVDNHRPFVDELHSRARAAGVLQNIDARVKDMAVLGEEPDRYDLVWCEGAIFILGFREGLEMVRKVLRQPGFCAVSEISWLREGAPEPCLEFFAGEYPAMTSMQDNLKVIESTGYQVVDTFVQPESAWWEPYYTPLEIKLARMRPELSVEPEKLEMLEGIQREIEIFREYSEWYGNVFYLMKTA